MGSRQMQMPLFLVLGLLAGCGSDDDGSAARANKCRDACKNWHACMQLQMETKECKFADGRSNAEITCAQACVETLDDLAVDGIGKDVPVCLGCMSNLSCDTFFDKIKMPCESGCDSAAWQDFRDTLWYQPGIVGTDPTCKTLFQSL